MGQKGKKRKPRRAREQEKAPKKGQSNPGETRIKFSIAKRRQRPPRAGGAFYFFFVSGGSPSVFLGGLAAGLPVSP